MKIQKDLEGKPREFNFGWGEPRRPKKPRKIPNLGEDRVFGEG